MNESSKAHELKPEAVHDSALVGAQKRKLPKCWTCDEVGHIQWFCPKCKEKSQHRAKVTEDEFESDSDGEGAFSVSDEVPEDKWLMDSGASSHMTPKREYFTKYRSFSTPEKVSLGDGRVVEAVGVGTFRLNMLFKVSNSKRAVMYDVLHVPKLACNLFSVRAAAKRGNTIKFCQSRCWIRGPKGTLEGMGSLAGKLYHLRCEVISGKENASMVTKECGEPIMKLRTDNGGEYMSKDFQAYLTLNGIEHQLTIPHSPQQNGVAERLNRTLMESARAMLSHANLPNKFWAEAVATAAYLRNRTTTSANEEQLTPFEKWYGHKPNISHLRVFGCAAYSHVPSTERRKLDKKAQRMCFIGYSKNPKGYRLIDLSTDKVVTRRDVVFNETDFRFFERANDESVSISPELLNESKDETIESEPQPDEPPRRSQRAVRCPDYYGYSESADTPTTECADTATLVEHCAYSVQEIPEPETFDEALSSPHAKEWKLATDSEYQSLIDNDTWDLVELPEGRTAVGCKWVFKVKYNGEGKVERFKSRLVAKGYSQRQGLDFEETFSPVVRFSSIRTLLALAIQKDMIVHQMDVVTAFLNGELDEEIYMQQPDGYQVSGKENLVCRLKKSLYGLKQAPRCWNRALREFMMQAGFVQSNADPCVFIRLDEHTTIVAVYVDDLILITDVIEVMLEIKGLLSERFRMKDMGQLHYCLGVNIVYGQNCVWLHQKQYITLMLGKFGLTDVNTVSTPADCNVKLVKDDHVSKSTDQVEYQSMVGSLLYIAMGTRPDIAQAVGAVSKFCSNPTEAHKIAVKRIFRYLKKTMNLALKYCKDEKPVTGFSDADWGGDLDDRRSTTGNVFLLAGGAVSWLSKKQAVVALSTSEAEYVALSLAAQEAEIVYRSADTNKTSCYQGR